MKPVTPGIYADSILDESKREIQADFRRKHEELRKCRELFRDTIESLRTKGLAIHSTLWNAALHVNLAAEDLSYLVEDLAFERNDWKRRMAARHVALTAYETAEDLQALFGKTLRDALDQLGVLPHFEKELGEVRKPLQEFWGKHQKSLKQIRITAAAHRDHDGMVFVKTVEDINIEDILGIGFELNDILLGIGQAMKEVLDGTSQIQDPQQKAAAEAMNKFQELAEKILSGYPAFDKALSAFGLEIERINARPRRKDDSDYRLAFSNFNRKLENVCVGMQEASTGFKATCEADPMANMLANPDLIDADELREACDLILKGTAKWKENIAALQTVLNAFRGPQSTIKAETDDLTRILGLFDKANFDLSHTATAMRDDCRH